MTTNCGTCGVIRKTLATTNDEVAIVCLKCSTWHMTEAAQRAYDVVCINLEEQVKRWLEDAEDDTLDEEDDELDEDDADFDDPDEDEEPEPDEVLQ